LLVRQALQQGAMMNLTLTLILTLASVETTSNELSNTGKLLPMEKNKLTSAVLLAARITLICTII
jgi:hypothetical protein